MAVEAHKINIKRIADSFFKGLPPAKSTFVIEASLLFSCVMQDDTLGSALSASYGENVRRRIAPYTVKQGIHFRIGSHITPCPAVVVQDNVGAAGGRIEPHDKNIRGRTSPDAFLQVAGAAVHAAPGIAIVTQDRAAAADRENIGGRGTP